MDADTATAHTPGTPPRKPRVIIVGGGFGGIEAARALARSNAQVVLIDQRNHHLFQPLLYQVATAALSPADIAAPIRSVLRRQANCIVVLAEVTGVDPVARRVQFATGWVEYDWLVLAAGATHSYFANPEWERLAPGLKTIDDATEIRRRILLAFERAEHEGSETARKAALTFAIVGGGPTGVELAGAIKEIAAQTIQRDFRHIDTRTTRVILLQSGDRVLPGFPPDLSERAKRDLEALGVEVRLGARVTEISKLGVVFGDEFIPVRNVFWAAGVKANPIGASLGAPLDRAGRVVVQPDLSVPGYPNVFVIGDMAAATCAKTGRPIPGVAQAALQGGKHAGRIIARALAGQSGDRPGFVYKDKGNMATIGRSHAVADINGRHLTGFLAWVLWSVVHVMFLVEFRNRAAVIMNWIWNWFVFSRGARLITGDARLELEQVRPFEAVFYRKPVPPDAQPAQSPTQSSPAQSPPASTGRAPDPAAAPNPPVDPPSPAT